MQQVLNTLDNRQIRRQLRRNQTGAEKLLWRYLRNRQLEGHKFCRQYGVGKYVVDFYCSKRKLSVELDGGQHNELEYFAKDERRKKFLEAKGVKEIRFWNNDVMTNTEGVLDTIKLHLTSSLSKEEEERAERK